MNMARTLLTALLLFFTVLLSRSEAFGQRAVHNKNKSGHEVSYFNTPADWYQKVKGKPFPLQERYMDVRGSVIDFGRLQHPAIICFGFAACPPCRHELPVYRAAAASYPEVDFIYITYDDEATRLKELQEIGKDTGQLLANYYVLHMTLQDIDNKNLTLAYPTQYFIGKEGLIHYMNSGGDPDEPADDIRARIDRIIAGKE